MTRSVSAALLTSLMMVMMAGQTAVAREWHVGPTQVIKLPSEAILQAQPGDTVAIDAGSYFDCAVIHTDRLTIHGTGADAVMTDKTCAGKGILVVDANDVTIAGLTLQRARVPDGNGAGIRAEGRNLTVRDVRFINNENGLLGNPVPDSTVQVIDSMFDRNGKCEGACAHGLYIGEIKLLRVEGSRFIDTQAAHSIKSRALRTEVVRTSIADGPNGTSSYQIEVPNGGSLLVEDCTLEKGPNSGNRSASIVIGSEGVSHPTPELVVRRNVFTNDTSGSPTFVRNQTATEAELSGNVLKGRATALSGDGSVQ